MVPRFASNVWCSSTRTVALLLIFVLPFICGQKNGDLRLVGGHQPGEGRVEVYMSGVWGTVCDDGWGEDDAAVVCRQLGYSTIGASSFCCAHFGQGSGPILMDDLDCTGSEHTLRSCRHNPAHNCWHGEDASVRCQRNTCQNGENGNLRLVSESSIYEGRVEVCLNGRWGTVCDENWSTFDAQVACRQLGYKTEGVITYSNAYFGQGTGPILLDNLGCFGSEARLVDCYYDSNTTDCSHSEDAGIRCQPFSCDEGELRFIGGLSPREGQVEICLDQRWGSVNKNVWTTADAEVICRQLGYAQGTVSDGSAFISQGTGPVLISNVTCSGSESRLIDCSYDTTINYDSLGEIASISCVPANCQDGDVRLVEGLSSYEGRVEVCIGQRWGTVCDSSWSTADCQVVCRQLGYSTQGVTPYRNAYFGQGTGPILLDRVACHGSESKLLECIHVNETSSCRHIYDAGLTCQPFSCEDGELRLFGGNSAYEGRVEMCLTQRWGTVHDNEWSISDAQVVCRQLGYDTQGVTNYSNTHSAGPTFLDNVVCSGSELKLQDCSYGVFTSGDSKNTEDAGVRCLPYHCQDGDVRLVDDLSVYKGRVEVCFSQKWMTVCSEGWSTRDAQVVCRQLGYPPTVVPQSYTANYEAGPRMMKNVGCYGWESHLMDCSYSRDTHGEDCSAAGVYCIPVPSGTPEVISGVRVDPHTFEIEFLPVTKEENSGEEISSYVVTYSLFQNNICYNTSTDYNMTVSSSVGSTTALIGDLEASQEYCVAVAAKSQAGTGNYSQTLLINKYSSARVQIEMTGEITCNVIPISTQSSIITSVVEQLVTQVKNSCHGCTFTVNHIRDSRIVCCGNRLDAVAYQARIISSHDVSLDTITSVIDQWIATKPAVQGGNLVLNVWSTWQYGLEEGTLHVKCSSEQQEQEQDDSSTTLHFVIVWIIVAVLAVVIVVLFTVLAIQKCPKRRTQPTHSVRFQDLLSSETQQEGSYLKPSNESGVYSVPPDAGRNHRNPRPRAFAAGRAEMLHKSVHTDEQDNYEEMAPGEVIYEDPDCDN